MKFTCELYTIEYRNLACVLSINEFTNLVMYLFVANINFFTLRNKIGKMRDG